MLHDWLSRGHGSLVNRTLHCWHGRASYIIKTGLSDERVYNIIYYSFPYYTFTGAM